MQVIIVQAEIETAIRNHILSLVSVNPGMRVDVDIAATRGKDGFSATIDIVPEASEPTKKASDAEQESQPEVAEKKTPGPKPKAKVVFGKKADPEPVQEVVEEIADPKEEPAPVDATSSDEPAFEPTETQAEPAQEQAEEEVPPAQPVARSLFGKLTKPVNS